MNFTRCLFEQPLIIMQIYELSGNQTYSVKRKQKSIVHPKNALVNFIKSSPVLSMKILSWGLMLFTKSVALVWGTPVKPRTWLPLAHHIWKSDAQHDVFIQQHNSSVVWKWPTVLQTVNPMFGEACLYCCWTHIALAAARSTSPYHAAHCFRFWREGRQGQAAADTAMTG